MVLRRDEVLHPGILGDADPFLRIVFDRVELVGVFLTLGNRDVSAIHDAFTDPSNLFALVGAHRHGIESPVDEHTEARILPPRYAFVLRFVGFVQIVGWCTTEGEGVDG